MSPNRHDIFKYGGSRQGERLFFVAGPCVIESESLTMRIAARLAALAQRERVDIIFKASYTKANRTALGSYAGPGIDRGLAILEKIKRRTGLPLLTDIHHPHEAAAAAAVVDVVQIPAFLCRQTDLLQSAGRTGRTVNIKKGQFMAPDDMRYAAEKAGGNVWITERGTFFGYHRLVVDYAGIVALKGLGCPVLFDATHSVQEPGGGAGCSSGRRELALPLARAAVAVMVDGLFFEVHPDPRHARCDGANSLDLETFEKHVPRLVELHERVRELQ